MGTTEKEQGEYLETIIKDLGIWYNTGVQKIVVFKIALI